MAYVNTNQCSMPWGDQKCWWRMTASFFGRTYFLHIFIYTGCTQTYQQSAAVRILDGLSYHPFQNGSDQKVLIWLLLKQAS